MKQFLLLWAAGIIVTCTSTDAQAQGFFGRVFRSQPTIQNHYTPTRNYYFYTPSTSRVPRPATGYGSNLHRNFQIRQAQQKTVITGIPPQRKPNIQWAN